MRLSHFIAATALATVFQTAPFATQAQSQPYPNKPIRVIVPYAAGGSGDIVGRTVGARLTQAWGVQVLIDNRAGAAGTIGTALVAKSPADGYTLLLSDDSPFTITPHIRREMPYDPENGLLPVIAVAVVEFVLTVNPSVPASGIPELVALLKANPAKYSYASSGIGSIHHLSMEWFKQLAGVDIVHIPYKGSGQILPDVIAGQVPITYTGLAQTMPMVKAGKLRALALGGPRRVSAATGVPSLAETYPGFNGTTAWNFFAPAGTPNTIVQKINSEVNAVLKLPDVAESLSSRGLYPVGGTVEEFSASLKEANARWGRLIKQIGLKPE